MSPELSVAVDLSESSRQIVPQAWSCDSEASVTEGGSRPWNSEWSIWRWAEMAMVSAVCLVTYLRYFFRPADM